MRKLLISIFIFGLVIVSIAAADSPYARRIRPFGAVPGTCVENEVGYSMTLHNFYGCDNVGYKQLALVGSSSFAPISATYITQTADATLTNEQALGSLATGILKNTTTTGILSIAVAGTDYENVLTFSSPLSRSVNTISCPTCGVTGSSLAQFAATSSAQLLGIISDETGTGLAVFNTSPALVTPNIGVATGTSLNVSGNITAASHTGPTIGVTTNSDAAAGQVGEYISSTLSFGSRTSLTNATAKTITSISLTAGDWDVGATVVFFPAATTAVTQMKATISLVNNTVDGTVDRASQSAFPSGYVTGADITNIHVPSARLSLASTTTVYIVGVSNFGTSTMEAYGMIHARRIR